MIQMRLKFEAIVVVVVNIIVPLIAILILDLKLYNKKIRSFNFESNKITKKLKNLTATELPFYINSTFFYSLNLYLNCAHCYVALAIFT